MVRDGDEVALTLSGCAESDSLETLNHALIALHEDAIHTPTRTSIVDVRALEFATSSALRLLVTWLQRVQALDGHQRYQVVFRSNPKHSWQRRSLGTLAVFAAGIVQIEEAQ